MSLTSVAAGRRLAQRAIVWQAVAVALVAGAFLAKGPSWALAALAGGGAVAVGGWLSGAIALGGGANPAAGALARLLLGVLAKWAVVLLVLGLAVGAGGLPPIAALVGVVAALATQMLAMASR
ncbi:hypothetical protein [Luteimonas huabeiensis]|uniref:hypothetical protein n=1 Tax=Luteimonas huabeiensis TaxID=1244513 RepID=UPI0004B60F0F|nr:hypothetical protein [Luteimonas huabeiensis]